MTIPERDFISDDKILFMGYSSKKDSFSRMLYKEFTKKGITVFPVNPNKEGSYDIEVFHNVSDLNEVPETAYVLMRKEFASKAVQDLKGSGVKRVLFQSKRLVAPEVLEECREAGMEPAVACPMMLIGGGLHKIHRFFASLSK